MSNLNWHTRRLPYLHRNWMAAVSHWQTMGIKLSSPSRQPGDKFLDHDDDHYHRPAKRRRFAANSPESGAGVDDLDGFLLPGDRDKVEKALRIEVLKIDHKDSSRVKFSGIFNGLIPPQVKDVTDSTARCRISISCQRNDERVILHVDSQICTIKTFKNPVGPSRTSRIYLPQPFHVPQEKILIERDDDDVFGLAESYTVLVELESAGDPNWPPLNLAPPNDDEHVFYNRGAQSSRQWVLSASIAEMFNRNRKAVALRLKKRKPQPDVLTDYVLDVDVRWTSGLSSSRMARRLEKDVMPSITVIHPSEVLPPDPPVTNGVAIVHGLDGHVNGDLVNGDAGALANGHVNGDVLDDADEQAEGELTPSRSRRARHQINYNLKLLSDQAAGKERRRRRKAAGEKTDHADECRITYLLPPEQFSVDDFSCCLCGAPHQSLSQLRAHLLGHEKYDFDFDLRPKGGYHVSVAHIHTGGSGAVSPLRSKVYQLGRPMRPFDLEKFLDGDDSWITSRLGPDNDRDLGPMKTVGPKALPEITAPKAKRKRALVPHTKQPLFDPLSKVLLEPGSEIRPYVADSTWLIQKHGDTLQDFVDVDANEKEYIKVWDAFIMKLHLTSELYLPREFLSFVRQKAPWIVAKPSRAHEFSKHALVLYTRNTIDEGVMNTALQCLNEARLQKPLEEPKPSPKQKLSNGCAVCGKLVSGPSYLVCSEADCKKRLYHDYCVTDPKIPIEDRDFWKCNSCAK